MTEYHLRKISNGWVLTLKSQAGDHAIFFKSILEVTDYIHVQQGVAAAREAPKGFRAGGAQVDIEEIINGDS